MTEKVLGLDIGTASVGASLVELDVKNDVGRIIDSSVECFVEGERAIDRREARSSRRVTKRRAARINKFKNIFKDTIDNPIIDIWEVRVKGLNELLSKEELLRFCLYFMKHRGFKIIHGKASEEDGKIKKGSEIMKNEFEKTNSRTIGEYLSNLKKKRNTSDFYNLTVHRSLIIDEIKFVFNKQREFGSNIATCELEKILLDMLNFVRPLKSVEGMIGNCSVEDGEKRAPKESYSFELYNFIQALQNFRFLKNNREEKLTKEEIQEIVKYYINSSKEKISFKEICKFLNKGEVIFKEKENKKKKNNKEENKGDNENSEKNNKGQKKADSDTTEKIGMKNTCDLKKLLKEDIENYNEEEIKDLFNKITTVFVAEKEDEKIIRKLVDFEIPCNIISTLIDNNYNSSKVSSSYSIKALDKLIPLMLEEGYRPEEAREIAYPYNDSIEKLNYLPVIKREDLPSSPVVKRAVTKTRKIINKYIKEYGMPNRINFELGRELGKSEEVRNKITAEQNANRKANEKATEDAIVAATIRTEDETDEAFEKEGKVSRDEVSDNQRLMFRLWREQGMQSPYSPNKFITARDIVGGNCEIDHVFPYSRSYDDRYINKVLCFKSENQEKKERTPYEWLSKERFENYLTFIENCSSMSKYKKYHLSIAEPTFNGFKGYQLASMREASNYMLDYIRKYLPVKVFVGNGPLTAGLRNQWGLKKDREESDRHHALDAIVIACMTPSVQNKITRESQAIGKKGRFQCKWPWKGFGGDVQKAYDNIFVKRVERKKIKGALHEETVRGIVRDTEGSIIYTTKRTSLNKLSASSIKNIREFGVAKVIHNIERDKELMKAIENRLKEKSNESKGENIFEEPLIVRGNEVKKVKIIDASIEGFHVRGGLASNGDIVRLDVYSIVDEKGKKRYGGLPIYVAGEASAVSFGRNNKKKKEECKFEYSLYKNSIVEYEDKGITRLMYYKSYNVCINGTTIKAIDGSYKKEPSLNNIKKSNFHF